MGYLKYVRALWTKPKEGLGEIWKQRMIVLRNQPVTLRVEHPTRPDRARSLGFKAKQGVFAVQQRVLRGGHKRPSETIGGRRSKHSSYRMNLNKSYQQICEERANKKFPNCEVLGSYYLAHDGQYAWYEIIFVDRDHPSVLADPHLSWIAKQRGRVFRGLTSAGKKSRGLLHKGKGAEKVRPSKRANWKRRLPKFEY